MVTGSVISHRAVGNLLQASCSFRISVLCIYCSHGDTQYSQELSTLSLPIPRGPWKVVLDFINFADFLAAGCIFWYLLCKVNRKKKKFLKKRAGNNTTFGFITVIKYLLLHGKLYAEFQYTVISVKLKFIRPTIYNGNADTAVTLEVPARALGTENHP